MTWDKSNPGFGSGLGYGRMDPASDGMWSGAALKEEGNGPWRNLLWGSPGVSGELRGGAVRVAGVEWPG